MCIEKINVYKKHKLKVQYSALNRLNHDKPSFKLQICNFITIPFKRKSIRLHASFILLFFFLLSLLRKVYPFARIIDNNEICNTSVFSKNNYQFLVHLN